MSVKQLSFKIIPCPMDICSPHTHLVISGRGVPHEPLALFYEELQKSCTPGTMHSMMSPLLSFFSFLEEPQCLCDVTLPRIQENLSSCKEAMEVPSLPPGMAWAAPPSELQGQYASTWLLAGDAVPDNMDGMNTFAFRLSCKKSNSSTFFLWRYSGSIGSP